VPVQPAADLFHFCLYSLQSFPMTLEHHAGPFEQGAFVRLASKGDTVYQVLSLDADADRCWLRRWPLSRQGSPPFSVPLNQLRNAELMPA